MSLPLTHIIFVADAFPEVTMEKDGKRFATVAFKVPIAQLEHTVPAAYLRVKAAGIASAQILVAHADMYGNFAVEGYLAVKKYNPDALFCCYPADARRAHPDFNIVGFWDVESLIRYDITSRVVQLMKR